MISANLRFEGFDAASWTKIISLFAPGVVERIESEPASSDAPEQATPVGIEAPRGTLVVVVDDDDNVLRATNTLTGRVTGIPATPIAAVPDIARLYGASQVVWFRRGTMEELAERLAMRLRPGDDYGAQWLVLARVMRELGEARLLRLWPNSFAGVPIPSMPMLSRALDVVLPDGHAAVAVLWQRGEPWTSVAVRRMGGEIDWIAGPDLISRWTGPLGGDWRRDHRVIAAAVARNMAPVHVGLFSEEHIVRDLLRTPDAGRWARAAAVRDIAFYPTPAYVGVALGADVVRSATRQAASFLGGLKLFESIAPIAAELRSRVTDVASVSAALGFNPLEALGRFLRGEDRSSLPASTLPAPEESGADNGENGQ